MIYQRLWRLLTVKNTRVKYQVSTKYTNKSRPLKALLICSLWRCKGGSSQNIFLYFFEIFSKVKFFLFIKSLLYSYTRIGFFITSQKNMSAHWALETWTSHPHSKMQWRPLVFLKDNICAWIFNLLVKVGDIWGGKGGKKEKREEEERKNIYWLLNN